MSYGGTSYGAVTYGGGLGVVPTPPPVVSHPINLYKLVAQNRVTDESYGVQDRVYMQAGGVLFRVSMPTVSTQNRVDIQEMAVENRLQETSVSTGPA